MSARSPEDSVSVLQAFHKGLREEGDLADGENVKVEYRWARGKYGLLPALASEFVERRVNRPTASHNVSARHSSSRQEWASRSNGTRSLQKQVE
jgi:hypothetical protein